MALIAHWPLNGNTNDYSGFGNDGTISGNVTFGAGKIGEAFVTNASTGKVVTNILDNELPDTFSITGWVKIKEWGLSQGVFGTRLSPNGFMLYRNPGDSSGLLRTYLHYTNGSGTTTTTSHAYSGFELNKWHHFVIIRGNGFYKTYVDGVLRGNSTLSSFTSWNKGTSNFSIGSGGPSYTTSQMDLNDIRLYDHELTDMEIQEIARAKILHYTFDDMQEPTTNITTGIISNYGGATSYSNGTSLFQVTRVSDSIVEGPYTYSRYIGTINSSNNQVIWHMSYRGTADFSKTFTVSAFLRGSGTCHFTLYDDGTSYKTSPDFTLTNTWTKYSYTGTFSGTYTTNHWVSLRGILDTTTVDISSLQIEEKPYATEFTEGTRTGRVNDYSGFFNHSDSLTETNTPRWTPEAKIGTGAYKLNGNNYFLIPKYNASNDASLSLWFKSDLPTSTSQIVIGSPNSISFGIHNNTIIGMATTSAPVGLLSGSPYTVGQWNHIVITRDTSNVMSYYINGIKISNGSNNNWGWNDDPYGIIGRRTLGSSSSTYYANGEIDDVRVYATTLSDKDIKDLYEARAEIEQSGILYARDFLSNAEETENLLSTMGYDVEQELGGGTNEFVRTYDITPLLEEYGNTSNDVYSYSVDIKSLDTTNNDTIQVYMQSGSGTKYNFISQSVKVTTEYQRFYFEGLTPSLSNSSHTTSHLAFYGTYDTGNVPVVKNFQIEKKDHATPFTSTYRLAIQLPSTIEFGANEIHETGTANFEDFSTVGITDGLVGYWPLNNNSKDYSGNNYNGINSNISYVSGYDNNLNAEFNNSYIEIAGIPPQEEWTFSVMIYHSSTFKTYECVLGGTGSERYPLLITNGKVNVYDSNLLSPVSLSEGWNHIVTSTDGTNTMIYINGEKTDIKEVSRSSTITTIGHEYRKQFNEYYIGKIQNVKFFNRALSAEEISIEYNTMFKNEVQIHGSGVLYAKDIIQY